VLRDFYGPEVVRVVVDAHPARARTAALLGPRMTRTPLWPAPCTVCDTPYPHPPPPPPPPPPHRTLVGVQAV
jgi:hypothetical protein